MEALVNGKPLKPDSLYSVATNLWLLYGLKLILNISPEFSETTTVTEYYALLHHVSKFDTLHYTTEGRIVDLAYAVKEFNQKHSDIESSPNFFIGDIYLNYPFNTDIFNISGRKIKTKELKRNGIYFIKINKDKRGFKRKIIILK